MKSKTVRESRLHVQLRGALMDVLCSRVSPDQLPQALIAADEHAAQLSALFDAERAPR